MACSSSREISIGAPGSDIMTITSGAGGGVVFCWSVHSLGEKMAAQTIKITGARQHNLKNLTLEIPREKLVVITGMSGSGKSSLAFDTLYAEGQRRYVESLSAY